MLGYQQTISRLSPCEHREYVSLLKMGITKISPTCIGSGSGVNLSICQSVTLCAINRLISLLLCIRFGQICFSSIWVKKYIPIVFFRQGPVGPGPGPKKQWFVKQSQPFENVLVWKWKLRPNIIKRLSWQRDGPFLFIIFQHTQLFTKTKYKTQ